MARYRNFDGALGAGTDTKALHPALDDVRLRRAGLKAALSGLELALAAPFANRADWVTHVREALDVVHEVWTRHIVETEAPGAFLDELVTESPRLSTPASRLRREHSDILATIVREEEKLATPPSDDDDSYTTWAEDLRVELTALLAALARHRQRGADLVYEAYAVDLGGGY
ncbi:MAG TPA: hypothetical protein VGP92_05740 [Acidimicrobiia bacterium]|jgi:hypothetical protein|nr:hypothetical protein [Acidimicrobiia bacterium]